MGRGTESKSHPGWIKRTFWYFTCSQSSVFVEGTKDGRVIAESYPSLDMSFLGHVLMALLWTGAVGAYATFVIYQFMTLPDKETFELKPAADFDPSWVTLQTWCTRPPYCGNITITADYSQSSNPKCRALTPVQYTVEESVTSLERSQTYEVPLCFTDTEVFTTNIQGPLPNEVGLLVDFLRVDPGYFPNLTSTGTSAQGIVRLTSSPVGASALDKLMVIESWQVKTLVMGQDIVQKYGEIVKQTPFPINVQYEGRRPSWRATAVINLASYVDFTDIVKKAQDFTIIGIMTLLGQCCGMAFMMNSLNSYLVKFFVWVCPGPAELARREEKKKQEEAKKKGEDLDEPLVEAAAPTNTSTPPPSSEKKPATPPQTSTTPLPTTSGGKPVVKDEEMEGL